MPNQCFETRSAIFSAVLTGMITIAVNSEVVAERPNIVLILADDVGCEPLGCYGGSSYKTPNLDRLAAGGMRFRHCYSMPSCHPTRINLLTGRYPFRLRNPKWGSFPKAVEKQTIAHTMKNAGYATAVAGKWQLTMLKDDLDHPHRLGFDQYCLFGWHEGPRYYEPLLWQNGKRREDVNDRYGPDVYCDFLIDFFKKNQKKPFFAFYSMALCHDVTDDLEEPVPYGPNGHYDTYAEMMDAMDKRVGRIVDALDELKLREETLILFTGDNGTAGSYIHAAENGKYIRKPVFSKLGDQMIRGGKTKLTNWGTNVPLIASWPGKIKPGQVVDDLVDMSDFLPTCAALSGRAPQNRVAIDGHSFAARLTEGKQTTRQWTFAAARGKHWVRDHKWKLYSDGRFFDVSNDPFEKTPVKDTDLSKKAAKAKTKLVAILKSLNAVK